MESLVESVAQDVGLVVACFPTTYHKTHTLKQTKNPTPQCRTLNPVTYLRVGPVESLVDRIAQDVGLEVACCILKIVGPLDPVGPVLLSQQNISAAAAAAATAGRSCSQGIHCILELVRPLVGVGLVLL